MHCHGCFHQLLLLCLFLASLSSLLHSNTSSTGTVVLRLLLCCLGLQPVLSRLHWFPELPHNAFLGSQIQFSVLIIYSIHSMSYNNKGSQLEVAMLIISSGVGPDGIPPNLLVDLGSLGGKLQRAAVIDIVQPLKLQSWRASAYHSVSWRFLPSVQSYTRELLLLWDAAVWDLYGTVLFAPLWHRFICMNSLFKSHEDKIVSHFVWRMNSFVCFEVDWIISK
jgi:hypothetical protein